MKAIDKIIFNELASRKAVVLPGVGTLGVVRRTAQMDGREVKAPVNQVVYSRKEAQDAPSVIALMEAMGVDGESAKVAYGEWLNGVKDGEGIRIEGVGAVRQDFFTPSVELEQMLNPVRSQPAARKETTSVLPSGAPVVPAVPSPGPPADEPKRGGNTLTVILLIIAILLLLALGCICLSKKGCTCGKSGEPKDANALYDKSVASRPLHVVIDGEPVVAPPSGRVEPEQPQAPAQAPKTVAPAQKKYHLIAGSFVYESNADEMIAKYKRLHPELNIEKIVTSAWVMVSVYQGDDAGEITDANRRLAATLDNREMWVYRKR